MPRAFVHPKLALWLAVICSCAGESPGGVGPEAGRGGTGRSSAPEAAAGGGNAASGGTLAAAGAAAVGGGAPIAGNRGRAAAGAGAGGRASAGSSGSVAAGRSAAGAGAGGRAVAGSSGTGAGTSGASGTAAPDTGDQTVGAGDIAAPAKGPAPTEAMAGASWVLVKNWDFGTQGTLRDIGALSAEFQYHDQFNTIGNGTNYGAVIVAPNAQTAIPNQPIEDPARPYRELTGETLKTYVRPLTASQTTVSASKHDAGCGSIVAKWTLPSGGQLLGKDLLWETRARMPVPAAAYWFAIWTAGNKWSNGAEMDVLESFGTPNIYPPPAAFHVNSVGGSDQIVYDSWPSALTKAGVPMAKRDLREWHTWTWLYKKDDTYVVYYDGYVVQSGRLRWTLGGGASGEKLNMWFLIDLGWGHTQISDVNITLPASSFPITYEVDYSRVYLR